MEAKELIDLLFPEHDTFKCSDDNLSNGFEYWYNLETLHCRCRRCGLLQILKGEIDNIPLDHYDPKDIRQAFKF